MRVSGFVDLKAAIYIENQVMEHILIKKKNNFDLLSVFQYISGQVSTLSVLAGFFEICSDLETLLDNFCGKRAKWRACP